MQFSPEQPKKVHDMYHCKKIMVPKCAGTKYKNDQLSWKGYQNCAKVGDLQPLM